MRPFRMASLKAAWTYCPKILAKKSNTLFWYIVIATYTAYDHTAKIFLKNLSVKSEKKGK